jgi:hypothetical protein
MSESQHGTRNAPRSSPVKWLIGVAIGIAGELTFCFWMTSGALVDGTARSTRHHYSEVIDLVDLTARLWYGSSFAVAMALAGAVLVIRRVTGVGVPILLFGMLDVLAIVGAVGLNMKGEPMLW